MTQLEILHDELNRQIRDAHIQYSLLRRKLTALREVEKLSLRAGKALPEQYQRGLYTGFEIALALMHHRKAEIQV